MKTNLIFKTYSCIKNNNLDLFKTIINENSWILDIKTKSGDGIFSYTCKKDRLEFFLFLIEKNQTIINELNHNNENVLHILCKNNSTNILNKLLQFQENLSEKLIEKNKNGVSPLMLLMQNGDKKEILKFLALIPENEFFVKDKSENNLLHFLACNHKYSGFALKIFKDMVDDVNIVGIKPLEMAIVKNKWEPIRALLSKTHINFDLVEIKKLLYLATKNKTEEVFCSLVNFFMERKRENTKEIIQTVIPLLCFNKRKQSVLNEKRLFAFLNSVFEKKIFKDVFVNLLKNNSIPEFTKYISVNSEYKFEIIDLIIRQQNIKLHTRDIKNILKNIDVDSFKKISPFIKNDLKQEDWIDLIHKIIINKKDMFQKLEMALSFMQDVDEQDISKIISSMKKLPINQQEFFYSKDFFIKKIKDNYWVEQFSLITKTSDLGLINNATINEKLSHIFLSKMSQNELLNNFEKLNKSTAIMEFLIKKINKDNFGFILDKLNGQEKKDFAIIYCRSEFKKYCNTHDNDYMPTVNVIKKYMVEYKLKLTDILSPETINTKINFIVEHLGSKLLIDKSNILSFFELNEKYLMDIKKIAEYDTFSLTQLKTNEWIKIFNQKPIFEDKYKLLLLADIVEKIGGKIKDVFISECIDRILHKEESKSNSTCVNGLLLAEPKGTEIKKLILDRIFQNKIIVHTLVYCLSHEELMEYSIRYGNYRYLSKYKLQNINEAKKLNVEYDQLDYSDRGFLIEFLNLNKDNPTIFQIILEKLIETNNDPVIAGICLLNYRNALTNQMKLKLLDILLHKETDFEIESLFYLSKEIKNITGILIKEKNNFELIQSIVESDLFSRLDEKTKPIVNTWYLEHRINNKQKQSIITKNKI